MTDRVAEQFDADATLSAASALCALALEMLSGDALRRGPVSTPLNPVELAERFGGPIPHDGESLEEVLARVRRDVISDANRLSHPRYVGHQVSAPLPTGVWTDALISSLNNSLAVNEMSPTLSHVERQVIRWLCDQVGWGPNAGGTFTSGGTEASFTALLAARAQVLPDSWQSGVGAQPPVLLCGEHTHYAVTRAAGELGIGVENVVAVPADVDYRLDPGALQSTIERLTSDGKRILAVCATAGQTATGAFDDLEAIGLVCERFGLWLHVDGAHGASALLSVAHRQRLRGLERAHSIAWDPHKMMFLPLAAGALLVRDKHTIDNAFRQHAPYLFSGEVEQWNIGVRSFQCSRRADALKVWVALHRFGVRGIASWYDDVCAKTLYFYGLLTAHPRFEVLHRPECNILCFRWVGGPTAQPADVNAFNADLREAYNRSGHGWITATTLGTVRVLRVTIQNPRTATKDLEAIVEAIDSTALALLAHASVA